MQQRPRQIAIIVGGLTALLGILCAVLVGVFAIIPAWREQRAINTAQPSAPPPPDAPTIAAQPAQPATISDDFEDITARWDQSRALLDAGTLLMATDARNQNNYALFLGPPTPESGGSTDFAASSVRDFDLTVDVGFASGDPDGEYGIRFRQSGPLDYLMFSVSGTGYYRLVRVRGGVFANIVPWTFDGRVRAGAGVTNTLRMVADGERLRGSINGAELLRGNDDAPTNGQLTLGIQSYGAGVAARFDNARGSIGNLLIDDDFANSNARWSIGGSRIIAGQYEITTRANVESWQMPLPVGSSRSANVAIEVTASLTRADGDGVGYGIIFGDTGAFSYWTVTIAPEGDLTLTWIDAQGRLTTPLAPTIVPQIKTGADAPNRLRVVVRGSTIELTVNGAVLEAVELPEQPRGDVGLFVRGGQNGLTSVRFDDVRIEPVP